MTFRFTDLSPDKLESYLAQIRRIASNPDSRALVDLDELIGTLITSEIKLTQKNLQEVEGELLENREEDLNRFSRKLAHFKQNIESGNSSNDEIRQFRRQIKTLGEEWEMETKWGEFQADANGLIMEAFRLIKDMDEVSRRNELLEFAEKIKKWESEAATGFIGNWFVRMLKSDAAELGSGWDKSSIEPAQEYEIETMKIEAHRIVEKYEAPWAEMEIRNSENKIIFSQSTVFEILEELASSKVILEEKGLLSEDLSLIIQSEKERGAWYRARSMISKAEVMQGTDDEFSRVEFLKSVQVVLCEDWFFVFGDEECPLVEL